MSPVSRLPFPAGLRADRLLRRVAVNAAGVAALTTVVAPTVVAAGLTAVDMVKRRHRKARPAPKPGTHRARVGSSTMAIHTSGQELYDEMIAAIDGAQESVKLETYIWKDDATGRRFVEALNRAAERGVTVHAIYDGFGNLVVPKRFYTGLSEKVHVYRLPAFTRPYWRGIIRHTGFNHSKVLVVDGRIGFVGGFNIGDDYATTWRDTHVQVEGPSVWGLDHSIATVWNASHPEGERMEWFPPEEWATQVRVASNLPVQLVYPIRESYLTAIERAQRHIYISTPYFIPDQQVLRALKAAAARGVDVQVMVPKDSNHIVADWVSRGFYAELLEAGITILLYKACMIHAKTATVDGQWSTVGTANIDRLSLGYNYETNIGVLDPEFAAQMERIFAADARHCERVDHPRWEDRHGLARVIETLLRPLRPLL